MTPIAKSWKIFPKTGWSLRGFVGKIFQAFFKISDIGSWVRSISGPRIKKRINMSKQTCTKYTKRKINVMAVFIIFSFICSLEWAPDVGSNVRFKTNKPVIYLLFTQSTSLNSNSRSFINFGPSYGTLREILYIGVQFGNRFKV